MQVTVAANPEATIMSLPIELDIMIMEWLPLEDALNFAQVLQIPEQVAVQYHDYTRGDFWDICDDLKPNSFEFLFKNKEFLIEANSYYKTGAAMKTFDLEFVKKYLQDFEPDLNDALQEAAEVGFTDAVKLLLEDSRVDPSAQDNQALRCATEEGHLEIVKLLLEDSKVNPSARNNEALINAADNGHLEIVKLFLEDARVDPSAQDNEALVEAAEEGHLEIVKLLLEDSRVDPSAQDNLALRMATENGHVEIVKLLSSIIGTL